MVYKKWIWNMKTAIYIILIFFAVAYLSVGLYTMVLYEKHRESREVRDMLRTISSMSQPKGALCH